MKKGDSSTASRGERRAAPALVGRRRCRRQCGVPIRHAVGRVAMKSGGGGRVGGPTRGAPGARGEEKKKKKSKKTTKKPWLIGG